MLPKAHREQLGGGCWLEIFERRANRSWNLDMIVVTWLEKEDGNEDKENHVGAHVRDNLDWLSEGAQDMSGISEEYS